MKKIFLLLFSIFFTISCYTQVTIKHFNASWNATNNVTWLKNLTDCSVKYYDITKYPELQKKYKVVVVPTIVIFQDGEEIERYKQIFLSKCPLQKMKYKKLLMKL